MVTAFFLVCILGGAVVFWRAVCGESPALAWSGLVLAIATTGLLVVAAICLWRVYLAFPNLTSNAF